MAAMGRVRTALQFRDFMLIESRKDGEADLKPPRVELQYNLDFGKNLRLQWTVMDYIFITLKRKVTKSFLTNLKTTIWLWFT